MKIADATFIVVDVETTGLDPQTDRVVEIAAVASTLRDPMRGVWASLVDPKCIIPSEVSALNGITSVDVEGAPVMDFALWSLVEFSFAVSNHTPFYAAHNFEFDSAFLGMGPKGVCTKRLAMKLWPAAPNHKNQTLRYWRGLHSETFGIAAHRALGDALVTAALLRDELTCGEFKALGIEDVDALIAYADAPILLELMPFGKHKGQPIASLPRSYIDWCLREMKDLSRDMRYTLERAIG